MSVWTKVQSKALYQDVDMELFQESLKELELTLDFSKTEVQNHYGRSKVDAAIKYQDKETALGIAVTSKRGITLVGDTYQSGIVGDRSADKLMNMMSQVYQKVKLKKELELQGWDVVVNKKQDKIVLECIQY